MTFYAVVFWLWVGFIIGAIATTAFWLYILKEGIKQGKFIIPESKNE